jgi:hypothetical protein
LGEITSLSEKIDELIFWTKFTAFPTFVALLRDALRDDVDKLVYDLSDGERTTRDIAELISSTGRRITHTTVANLWQRWATRNLVMPAKRVGRYRRITSLASVGIEAPQIRAIQEERGENNE